MSLKANNQLCPVRGDKYEKYTLFVASDTFGQPPYRIELDTHGGEGECPCRSWICDIHIRRREGEENQLRRLCKHLKKAYAFYGQRELKQRMGDEGYAILAPTTPELIRWAISDVRKEIRRRRKERQRQKNERQD